jgi:NAD(P)H dehydrogenase (quinone)
LSTILSEKLIAPKDLIISAYSESSVPQIARDAGIQIRAGNLAIPETLLEAYAGADVLFLVSYPSVGPERFELHRNAIDAAKKVGVKHVIYTSLTWGGPTGNEPSVAGVLQAHLQTVKYLQEQSGLTWTIVREATYSHLWNNMAGFLRLDAKLEKGEVQDVVIPGDGPNHWANREELGEATGKIVGNWKDYINQTVTITGPRTYTMREILDLYTNYTGRKVNLQVVSSEKAIKWHIEHKSLPPGQEDFLPNWVTWHQAWTLGEAGYVTRTLETLLGRKPLTIEDEMGVIFGEGNELDTKDFAGI